MEEDRPLVTALGKAERDRVLVRGRDLTGELVGHTTFAEMTGLMLMGRMPGDHERRMLDALLVVLVEHGLVKPTVVARFVYSNAPESIQAAVAASLLGAGSRHLGSSEWSARMLQEGLRAVVDGSPLVDHAALEQAAQSIVDDYLVRRAPIPGIGHRTHASGDPRATRLFDIARETGCHGDHCRLIERIAELAGERKGRLLPVNVTGAIAAVASDLGLRWEITRAFALIGRTLGALAHIQEEMERPLADPLLEVVRDAVDYDG